MTRRGCGCCDGVVGYCCGSVGPLVENYVDSLTLGQQSSTGVWSLVELVNTPLLLVPCDGYQWSGFPHNGTLTARNFPCFAANFDHDFASGSGSQLSGQWKTTRFGLYDPFSITGGNIYSMTTNAGMSLFFDTTIKANVPLVGTSLTAVRGELLFEINTSSGTGTLNGTAPSGIQNLLSSTTYKVKINDNTANSQPYGVLTFRNAPTAGYCWPTASACNWANATLASGQWVRSGQPTETQSGAASFLYDITYKFWYLNVPYTSTSGSGVWRLRDGGSGEVDVYRNSNALPSESFSVPATCNGAISMNGISSGSASVLSFNVSGSTACPSCNDG